MAARTRPTRHVSRRAPPDPDGGSGTTHDLITAAVEEAARLLRANGAMVYLVDEATGRLRFAHESGITDRRALERVRRIVLAPGEGMFGRAVEQRHVVVTRDYPNDPAFQHAPEPDGVVADIGIRSMVVAPLVAGAEVFGALGTFSTAEDAFDEAGIALVRSLADHAAAAMANSRLINELDASRSELAERAETERALREINDHISAAADLSDVIQRAIDEAARLLRAEGARIDLIDPLSGLLRGEYTSGPLVPDDETWPDDPDETVDQGMSGQAYTTGRSRWTGDYLADMSFPHGMGADTYIANAGIRSVLATPLIGEAGPFGALTVFTSRGDAWDAADASRLEAIAAGAAIAITRASLIEELDRSRAALARRAEAERALREIAARITSMRDPAEILQEAIELASRLVRGQGAILDLLDPATGDLHWAYDDGLSARFSEAERAKLWISLGVGATGIAVAEDRAIVGNDDLASLFPPSPESTEFYARTGFRSMIAVPVTGEDGPLGVIEVYSVTAGAFDESDVDLIRALAGQAAIALTNSDLLARVSREEARFRGLVQTTPDVIWRADPEGRITFMADSAESLFGRPVGDIVGKHFGLVTHASSMDRAGDRYRAVGTDPDLIERVPLLLVRGDGATFDAEVSMTGVFEDGRWVGNQGTVRDVSERNRLERELRLSEERYRYLVQNAPDLVWSMDADARLTFLSEACERLTGFRPEELIGRHFGAIVHESSREVAEIDWTTALDSPAQEIRGRINLRHRDGSPVPAEFIAVASLDGSGTFRGANGSVRDMRERDRLEHELRRSEERYRFLVDNSPDIIFSVDTEGRFSYVSDTIRRALGRDPAELIGRPLTTVVRYAEGDEPGRRRQRMREEPDLELVERMTLIHADGRLIPFEVSSVGVRIDGEFAGVHGAARDIGERERLEADLRASEERYRFLIENSPDIIFATDDEGRFTFVSAAVETMTGYRTEELEGCHFSVVIDDSTMPVATERWQELMTVPGAESQAGLLMRGRDGHLTPVDVRSRAAFVEGRFSGVQGAARDISEQVRLQTELRRQAGELAAGEERAHLARELHDSVTQALFSMTLVSRSIELLLDRDLDAARAGLGQLRELQREALAEMRALIFELRPGNLEQEGLVRALKTHSGALQGRIGLPIVMDSDLDERLPLAVEEVLYRIAQEALHNVVKHAGAHEARLVIHRSRRGVTMTITDDGKGFDPELVPAGHLGLAGMRARAERIGARFSCTSAPGRGTSVEVSVPGRSLDEQATTAAAADVTATGDVGSVMEGSIRDG